MPAEDPGPPQMRPAALLDPACPALGWGPAAPKGKPHPRRLGSTPITGSRRLLTRTQWFEKGVMTVVLGMTLWVKGGHWGPWLMVGAVLTGVNAKYTLFKVYNFKVATDP